MDGQTEPWKPRTKLSGLSIIGITISVIGLLGVGLWGVMAAFNSQSGSVSGDSKAAEIVEIGVEDPMENPDHWVGRDESGSVVWEGTWDEYEALTSEGSTSLQADLRRTWLVPSVAITAVGLLVLVGGLSRRRT